MALKPPYSLEYVEAFEKHHDLILPPLLRHYLLNISRETTLKYQLRYTVDLEIKPNIIRENVMITPHMIEEGVCRYGDIIDQLERNPELYVWDIEEGSIPLTNELSVIVKGQGYGYVLINDMDEFALEPLSRWLKMPRL